MDTMVIMYIMDIIATLHDLWLDLFCTDNSSVRDTTCSKPGSSMATSVTDWKGFKTKIDCENSVLRLFVVGNRQKYNRRSLYFSLTRFWMHD